MLKELLDEGRTSMFTRDIAGAAVTTCRKASVPCSSRHCAASPVRPRDRLASTRCGTARRWELVPTSTASSTRFRHLSGYQDAQTALGSQNNTCDEYLESEIKGALWDGSVK